MSQWDEDEKESRRMEEHHAYTAPIKEVQEDKEVVIPLSRMEELLNSWVKRVVIIGAGGFGREAAEIAKRIERSSRHIELIGFLDDNKELHNTYLNGIRVLGGLDYFKDKKKKPYFACAIGDPKTKKMLVKRVLSYGYEPINLIDPDVDIFTGVKLGKGIIIQKGTCLAVNCIIEDHVHINFNCSIGHDVHIGKYSTISPLCALSGFTLIGMECFLGSGVITFSSIHIKRCKIGAGSVVTKDICENGVYFGNPAILHRRLE